VAERIVHQYGAPFRAACGLTSAHRAHGDRGKVTCPDCLALPDDVAARADYDQLVAAIRAIQARVIPPAETP